MPLLRSLSALALVVAVAYALWAGTAIRQSADPEAAAIRPRGSGGGGLLDADGAAAAVRRLSAALRCRTIASKDAQPHHVPDPEPFQALQRLLEAEYQHMFALLHHEWVSNFSLLLTWRGLDPSLRPFLALSHLDVVTAPLNKDSPGGSGGGGNWTHPPFSGAVADGWVGVGAGCVPSPMCRPCRWQAGATACPLTPLALTLAVAAASTHRYIWGRGALDAKASAIQQLEALAALLRRGYAPRRTLLLALGYDEEVGGAAGAAALAALLAARGVELEMVLDEGGVVLMDGVAAAAAPSRLKLVDRVRGWGVLGV